MRGAYLAAVYFDLCILEDWTTSTAAEVGIANGIDLYNYIGSLQCCHGDFMLKL